MPEYLPIWQDLITNRGHVLSISGMQVPSSVIMVELQGTEK